MMSRVLWAIDNEIDDRNFERLCTDLMYRSGYRRIVPLGGNYDLARDAEVMPRGTANDGERIIFQFSLEKNWKNKLIRELKRVRQYGHVIDTFVFVTSRDFTPKARDELVDAVRENYGWKLEMYGREWLRLQLENGHSDLAEQYLRIPEKPVLERLRPLVNIKLPDGCEPVQALMTAARFEEAIAVIRAQLAVAELPELWEALSWSYYMTYNYKEALRCIERALALGATSMQTLSIKACILTEDGIDSGSKVNLLLAKEIFEDLVTRSGHYISHYNLANVLVQLGRPQEARDHYQKAIDGDGTAAEFWKNLASCHHRLGDYDKELECFDRALAIDPNLVEALTSKGITLCNVFSRWEEGLELIDRGLARANNMPRWHYVYWWKAKFLMTLERPEEAHGTVALGLSLVPDDSWLLDLKAQLLAALWKRHPSYVAEAERFFSLRTSVDDSESKSWFELALISHSKGDIEAARNRLGKAFSAVGQFANGYRPETLEMAASLDELIGLYKHIAAYVTFRHGYPLEGRAGRESGDVTEAIESSLWLTNGLALHAAERAATKLAPSADAPALHEHLVFVQRLLEGALIRGGRIAASVFKNASKEKKIDVLSRILVLPDTCYIEEWSSIFWWSLRQVEATNDVLQSVIARHMEDENLPKWFSSLRDQLLEVANKELLLLRE